MPIPDFVEYHLIIHVFFVHCGNNYTYNNIIQYCTSACEFLSYHMIVDPGTDVVYSLCISDKTRLDTNKRNEGSCFCCFLHAAYCLSNRKKLLYTVASPAHGLLNKEKKKEKKVWQHEK